MKRNVGLHRLWKEAVIALRGTTCESCGEKQLKEMQK